MNSKINLEIIAQNKRAYYEYYISGKLEAGIVLTGSEVKSLRGDKINIAHSYVSTLKNEFFLFNVNIGKYKSANLSNYTFNRKRKLLLKKVEIRKLIILFKKKSIAIIPLTIYFNYKNIVKVLLGIVQGRKKYDKRELIKKRDWERKKIFF